MKKRGKIILGLVFLFVILSNISLISSARTVVSPISNSNHTGTAVFNVSFTNGTDYTNPVNATFYYNLSGVWTYLGSTTDCNINSGLGAGGTNFSSCNATLALPANIEARYSINATLANSTTLAYGASVITTKVMFDSKAPVVSFSGIANTVYYTTSSGVIVINVSVIDNGMGVNRVYFNVTASNGSQVNWVRAINSGNYYNITLDTSTLLEDSYTLTVYANDTQLGNLNNTEEFQITSDSTAPTISLSKSSSTLDSITVSYSCGGGTSGIASCTLSSSHGTVSGSTISGLGCSTGYTITVTAQDNSGNSATSSASYDTENCGGGGILTPILPKVTGIFASISPEKTGIMKNSNLKIGIKEIQIDVDSLSENVKITITKYDEKPAEVSVSKSGTVYQYLQINSQNLGENLEKASVQLRVEKSWIASNNLQKENVAFYKFDSSKNSWNELPTTFQSEDSSYYYYNTELTSFSYFAIGEKTEATPPTKEIITEITETLTRNYVWVWIIVIAIVLGLVIFFLFRFKKKKRK